MPTIDALPAEVLLSIFKYFIGVRTTTLNDTDGPSRRRRPVLLTHVSSTWRSRALGDPSLWTDVQIYGGSPLFFSFFSRSHPLPVDLTVVVTNGAYSRAVQDFLSEELASRFQELLPRIRTLNIWALNSYCTSTTLACITGSRVLPALTSLGMHSCNMQDWVDPWTDTDLEARALALEWFKHLSAPALQKLVCTGQQLTFIPLGRPITTLELHRIPPGMTTPIRLQHIFSYLTHLSTLVLGRLSCEEPIYGFFAPPQDQPVLAPALRNLAIASPIVNEGSEFFGKGCVPNCRCAIRNLVAENLEYIEVTGAHGEALLHLEHLLTHRIQRSTQPVTLFLNGCKLESLDVNAYPLPRYIIESAPSIDLQINPETAWSVENAKWNPEMVAFRSCVLHFPGDALLPTSLQILSHSPVVDNRVPVLLYPARDDFRGRFNFQPQFLDPQVMEDKFRDPEYDIDETEDSYFYTRGSDYFWYEDPSDDELIDKALDMQAFVNATVDVEEEMVDHHRLWKTCEIAEERAVIF